MKSCNSRISCLHEAGRLFWEANPWQDLPVLVSCYSTVCLNVNLRNSWQNYNGGLRFIQYFAEISCRDNSSRQRLCGLNMTVSNVKLSDSLMVKFCGRNLTLGAISRVMCMFKELAQTRRLSSKMWSVTFSSDLMMTCTSCHPFYCSDPAQIHSILVMDTK